MKQNPSIVELGISSTVMACPSELSKMLPLLADLVLNGLRPREMLNNYINQINTLRSISFFVYELGEVDDFELYMGRKIKLVGSSPNGLYKVKYIHFIY